MITLHGRTRMTEKIEELMTREEIPYGVIVNIRTDERIYLGDREKIKPDSLIKMCEDDMVSLYQSMEGQILPQYWGQGNVKMLISIPQEDIMVLFFYYKRNDTHEEHHKGKMIDEEVKNLLQIG